MLFDSYKKNRCSLNYCFSVAIDLLSLKMSLFCDNNSKNSTSILDGYLSSPEVDFKDIIGMVCDFLLAGIDTVITTFHFFQPQLISHFQTTYTSSFILYYLANNPAVQEKLYKESCSLLPAPHSPVTKDVLSQAQYAKAVLKESLRLRPVSVGVGRILQKDAEFSGYNVPKGVVYLVCLCCCCL